MRSKDDTQGGETKGSSDASVTGTLLQQGWAPLVDTQSAQQLTSIGLVRQARINQQKRELATLTATYGATDTRVVALTASLASQHSFVSVLGVARDIATTAAPAVPANGWVLHGRVRDKNLLPVAKLSVSLVDEAKSLLTAYGYSYTDSTGYFTITHDPAAPGASATSTPLSAYVQVLNKAGKPLFIDSSAFTIDAGATLYRDVALTSLSPLGAPPPGAAKLQAAGPSTAGTAPAPDDPAAGGTATGAKATGGAETKSAAPKDKK